MSEALEVRAEITKLARLLNVEEDEIAYLEHVSSDSIRLLRDQVADLLFDVEESGLHHLVALSRVLPAPLVASVTQKVVSPLLAARIGGHVDIDHAIAVTKRLPLDYLADVAVDMDPRRASDVIGGMPEPMVVRVASALAERGEAVAMGRFAAHLSDEMMAAAFGVIDDAMLIEIAFVLEDKSRLAAAMELLSDDRIAGIIQVAAEQGLWPQALDLVTHLNEAQHARLANIAARQEAAVLESLIQAAHDNDLWDVVLPMMRAMELDNLGRVARLPSIFKKPIIDELLQSASRNRLWPDVIRFADAIDDLGPIVTAFAKADAQSLKGLIDYASKKKNQAQLRVVLERMPATSRRQIRRRAEQLDLLDPLSPIAELLA